MHFPIVEQVPVRPQPSLCDAADRLAAKLLLEQPELAAAERFQDLVPTRLNPVPTLHLDDLSELGQGIPETDLRFFQERARLRAGGGDVIAASSEPVYGQEAYFRERLGLGSAEWIYPDSPDFSLRLAEACWNDEDIREFLISRIQRGELSAIHPHMGATSVWELAAKLREAARRPLKVIAPPPRLCRWVNDKIAFAELVRRLFGSEFVPKTESAWNIPTLAGRVIALAGTSESIGVKLPDGAGGGGNIVLKSSSIQGKTQGEVERELRALISDICWDADSELLVDVWERDVLCSPSAQFWVPPIGDGPPVAEGIFAQTMEGEEGVFVGAAPVALPDVCAHEIAERCWLLARVFQRLGYIGRCSFDVILVGERLENCRIEFIECNGRWGGTSLPMTLLNRLLGDWSSRAFFVEMFQQIDGLELVTFREFLDWYGDDVFDVRTLQGSIIPFNPGQLRQRAGISIILLGRSPEDVHNDLRHSMWTRLRELGRTALQRNAIGELATNH
jgi:hypothetical protein